MLDNAFDFLNGKMVAIDWLFGMSQFNDYKHKIELVKSGFPIKEVFEIRAKEISFTINEIKSGSFYNVTPATYEDFNTTLSQESIVSLKLKGFMSLNDGMYNHGAQSYYELLDKLSNNRNVKGVVLKVDTGGGEAMAGMVWHNGVKEFRSSGKPLIADVTNAASSGYLAILNADEIQANNEMVMVGSIGAVMNLDKKVLTFIQENNADLYAKKSTLKNKEVRQLILGDTSAMQDRLDEFVSIFHEKVIQNRPLKGDTDTILAGDMFFAKDALLNGLIDGISSTKEINKRIKSYI